MIRRNAMGWMAAVTLGALLPACSSLVPATQKTLEAVDPVRQDIAELVLILDLPAAVQPVPDTTRMRVVYRLPGQPDRQVDASLALADPGEIADTLAPPASGRAYYFLGFGAEDKARLRAAQAWARSGGNAAATGGLSVAPRFCGTEPVDINKARFSVNVTLPGTIKAAPLIKDEILANALALSNQTALEAC